MAQGASLQLDLQNGRLKISHGVTGDVLLTVYNFSTDDWMKMCRYLWSLEKKPVKANAGMAIVAAEAAGKISDAQKEREVQRTQRQKQFLDKFTEQPGKWQKYGTGGQTKAQTNKIAKVMREYKERKLHSGSKRGPIVTDRDQAIAIALSEAGVKRKTK